VHSFLELLIAIDPESRHLLIFSLTILIVSGTKIFTRTKPNPHNAKPDTRNEDR